MSGVVVALVHLDGLTTLSFGTERLSARVLPKVTPARLMMLRIHGEVMSKSSSSSPAVSKLCTCGNNCEKLG